MADSSFFKNNGTSSQLQGSASASAAAALASEQAALASENAAQTSETNAAASAAAALVSKNAAANSAASVGADAAAAAASATASQTAATSSSANAALTSADATQTAADRIQTGLDRIATAADAVQTAADRVQTGLDVTSTGASAAAALSSRNAAATSETNASASATAAAADAASTAADVISTAADAASTAADALATAADRVQTGLDATSASNSASAANTSASAASASQVSAAASAASAAAVFNDFEDRYYGPHADDAAAQTHVTGLGLTVDQGDLYFNSTANEMRVYDGGSWVAASSAGGASLINYHYTATASQTAFSGSDDNSNTLSYTVDNLIVTKNGIVLEVGTDYTATDGSTITLTVAAAAGDEINVVAFKSFTTADMVSATNGGTFQSNVTVNGTMTATAFSGDGSALTNLPAAGISDVVQDTTPQLGGNLDTNGNDITFGDSDKCIFGAGNDLQIYHNGSNSLIEDTGTGDLYIRSSNELRLQTAAGVNHFYAIDAGKVGLYYNGSEKLATTATGCDITGGLNTTGNVGIGTVPSAWNTFTASLQIDGTSLSGLGANNTALASNAYYNSGWKYYGTGSASLYQQNSGLHRWDIAGSGTAGNTITFTEAMRISSGSLLIGTTSSTIYSGTTTGINLNPDGATSFNRASGQAAMFNRISTDGDIVQFRKNGSTVGNIGSNGGGVFLEGPNYGFRIRGTGDKIFPSSNGGSVLDNVVDWGTTDARWDDIYATNGTIQTSDANEKQQIAALTDAEITAAKAISALFKTFKWNDAVAEKGDAARTHAGVIAQDVQAAMTAAGLDAGDYAFFISSTWWETQTEVPAVEAVEAVYEDVVIPAVLDEDGNEVEAERTEQRTVTEAVEAVDAYTCTDTYDTAEEAPEGAVERTRLGIRYPELLAFVGAATEQRLANIETRLTALETA